MSVTEIPFNQMEKMVEDLKRKSHLARTWGGDTTLDGVTREWSKLKETMTAHQTMFEHQVTMATEPTRDGNHSTSIALY